ncbi:MULTISPECIES: FecR domain-containing protein [Pseudomonadaceae]|uniref:FecR domain-containing protein n=1 Tax=Pseudomonadaceae TaxID=135621 RepID=UPI00084ACCA5|nr:MULTISPECIES: FecR family protein [Pseudomonas]OEC54182.1 iron dicitrate transport regulator FecR [Pseudomonas sp. ENNP23]
MPDLRPSGEPIATTVLEQAASWLLLMQERPLTSAERAELEHWQHDDPEHERAWQRAQRLLDCLDALPPGLARQALSRPLSSRRTVLRSLLLATCSAPLGWWLWQRSRAGLDYLTARGERRELWLEDGTQVALNSDSALQVRFSADQRLLNLQRGELYVTTAVDRQVPARPLRVRTGQGLMQALGTRFSVRTFPDASLLAVYQGAVKVTLDHPGAMPREVVLQAGQQVRFSHERFGVVEVARESALAWRKGLLVAEDMPLAQWAQELMRYSDRPLAWSPAAANLRVSGTFPVDDLPLALAMLVQSHGVRVEAVGEGMRIQR